MFARAAADILRLPRLAMETTFSPLAFAQRAFCAAAIRARPAAESFLRDVFLSVPLSVAIALERRSSCDVRRLCSCRSCARTTLRLDMQGIVTLWRAELLQQTCNALNVERQTVSFVVPNWVASGLGRACKVEGARLAEIWPTSRLPATNGF